MKIARSLRGLALGLALSCSMAGLAQAAGPLDAAREMVARQDLGVALLPMGMAAALRTQTYAGLVQHLGAEKAHALLEEELKRAAPTYRAQWEENLAQAYSQFFTAAELQSVADKGDAAPEAAKMQETANQVGAAMMQLSAPLLSQYVADALLGAQKRASAG
ncbi:hypothetical protein [Bordetella genomosp. 12]|uniref:DUF2059 domain-containing protein n=1 Tax=Bordetella genomosp. 12 TaxID=463035 RepID=A0A261VAW1_9BORD|nr:hypothetical protein [Bordetella genomosp. 12]OZI71229.1 hypothetical protein CAL22_15345 [Bordetella genomosp. 12]